MHAAEAGHTDKACKTMQADCLPEDCSSKVREGWQRRAERRRSSVLPCTGCAVQKD